ncbi:hypothetical protein [Ferruginibacter albus]|uniref:hypothetical protein n=1 Tax=Ferruginibacter albus TaxID=2875540 RepID=UPI001CC76559|nr:hypothetical protein [Ferruginibacter albus]UAY52749.1 hypothetical protein K9M53_03425 [Ferruginibacter albus]
MKTRVTTLFLLICISVIKTLAQDTSASLITTVRDSSLFAKKTDCNKLLTLVYDINIKSKNKKAGIEETYNGGIKTVFISNDQARIRLVSLMRIQSIFFTAKDSSNSEVIIVKESGKKKYKYELSASEWNLYNIKYKGDSCVYSSDSLMILNHLCRKAIINLKDGRTITAYYTKELKPICEEIEPAFADISGVVLQYSYEYEGGSITYTASKISENPISEEILIAPKKGYITKKLHYTGYLQQ